MNWPRSTTTAEELRKAARLWRFHGSHQSAEAADLADRLAADLERELTEARDWRCPLIEIDAEGNTAHCQLPAGHPRTCSSDVVNYLRWKDQQVVEARAEVGRLRKALVRECHCIGQTMAVVCHGGRQPCPCECHGADAALSLAGK